ncbi:MAG: class I SAM-dependent methyltransferase [Immundisolibacter sp.]|uniref:class I SAM-dependent methyltransferase n=1 Tax=Immundisolibacter sp. TaxID=1934948 RepID=UPI003D12FDA1
MASGKDIETRGHIVGFREEIAKAANASEDVFFSWFNDARDKDVAFIRGAWDFSVHMAQPLAPYLSTPEDKVAVEIGHGGARILAAASRHFGAAVGVDIHHNNAFVEAELTRRGITNVQLIQSDGKHLPLADNAVDVVYSFIVLQHVETYEIFCAYLAETRRVLKPGGLAVLYFGRKSLLSLNRSSRLLYWVDRALERVVIGKFRQSPAKVNSTNLRVSLSHAKALARRTGFTVLRTLVSHKRVPDGTRLYGGQNGLVLRKPAA